MHYRRPDGSPTSELDNFRQALRPVRRLYGTSSSLQFGPKALKAVCEHMIGLGRCRTNINKKISRIKSVFRWAVENELLSAEVDHALLAVRGLQRGRTNARESEPVKPAPEEQILAVKPFVSRQVWALIQLQLLSGARAGELVGLQGIDLKTSGDIWTVEPKDHKTAHLGYAKRIYFGPQAQEILREFLCNRPLDQHLFSAKGAADEHRAIRSSLRKTPLSCGNRSGTNVQDSPKRTPQSCYTVDSYGRAIERACAKAFPPPEMLARQKVNAFRGQRWESLPEWKSRLGPDGWAKLAAWRAANRWHPHQLRHNAATRIKREFGIEIARVILGHRSASVTEIYAELDDQKAINIMRKIG
ncbi:MAG: site-specific integrase [Tepidisphaeraceae bacterium]